MIKMTKELNTKIVGKGYFKKVTEDGIEIMDAKTGELETIVLNELVDAEISITVINKVETEEE